MEEEEGETAHPEGPGHLIDGFAGIDLDEEIPEEADNSEASEEQHDQPEPTDESIEIRDKIVQLIGRFQPTNSEMIRAVRVYQMVACLGQAFWAPQTQDFYHLSQATQHLNVFLSHSWQVKSWKKIMLLMVLNNLPPACAIGTLGSLLMMIPCIFLELQFPCCCSCAGLILWLVTFVIWRSNSTVFVDRMCINQFDERMKTEGILNIGAVLKASKCLLVVWEASYVERLWCMFEIAAFLKAHPEAVSEKPEMVQVKPLMMGFQVCLAGVSMLGIGTFVVVHPFADIFWLLVFLWIAMEALYLAHAFRGYFRSLDATNQQLQQFQLQTCHCWCCSVNHVDPANGQPIQLCDREIVRQCIMHWYGSEEEFDHAVQSVVAIALKQQMGSDTFDYSLMLGATVPILWPLTDLGLLWRSRQDFNALVYTVSCLSAWLWWIPTVATVGLFLARCLRSRGYWRCTEWLRDVLLAILATPSMIGLIALQELMLQLEDERLQAVCIAAFSFVIFAVVRTLYQLSNRRFFAHAAHVSSA